jgi:hypothetical protein
MRGRSVGQSGEEGLETLAESGAGLEVGMVAAVFEHIQLGRRGVM